MKRALISVSDKAGVLEFAQGLVALGFEIISTGGTSKALEAAGIQVINISDVTGFPECLDGRVKTLHPAIHGGLLAMRSNEEHMAKIAELGIQPIDVVAVNLYPFKATILKEGVTFEEAIENIDIGGPTMIRAAAKNWQDVAVIVDPADYQTVLDELAKGEVSRETKYKLCCKVFSHTAAYDALVASYLNGKLGDTGFADSVTYVYEKAQEMRYGENPHQRAAFYREIGARPGTLADAKQLHGKELSFNNINDANGALDLLREFTHTTVVAVKHANPCGVASADQLHDAYVAAYNADPVSIFGGIVAVNAQVDAATAEEMAKIFLEIIIAPSFTPEALDILTKKKNIRLLELPTIMDARVPSFDMKKVAGGLLIQDLDTQLFNENELVYATDRKPTAKEMEDLLFAWKLVKYTKSNGIAVAKDNCSLGIGPGQVNRIWATQQALERSGDKVKGAAMASDAYFPFPDCVEAAAAAGITAIIHPGGSVNDKDSIEAANKAGIAMVLTGMRHFRH